MAAGRVPEISFSDLCLKFGLRPNREFPFVFIRAAGVLGSVAYCSRQWYRKEAVLVIYRLFDEMQTLLTVGFLV